jgi:flagellar hook-associated protein 2
MAVENNLITALGAGSGVDVKSLAQSLTDAEKLPQQQAIQSKIDRSEAKISGYSAMMAVLNVFKKAFEGFSSSSSFNSLSVSNSQPSAFSATTSTTTAAGRHSIEVKSLARAQVSEFTWMDTVVDPDDGTTTEIMRSGFDSRTASVNGGLAFDMTLAQGVSPTTVSTISIPANKATPEGIVETINAENKGITARIVDTGASTFRYKIVLTGEIGAENQFTMANSDGKLAFAQLPGQVASDSEVTVDGVTFTREGNVLSDVIPGVTLSLSSTNENTPATLEFARDISGLKERALALVSAYNDTMSDLKILSGPKSEDPDDVFSGSLQNDSAVRLVSNQIRSMITAVSDTAGENVSTLRDLGFSLDRTGLLSLEEATFETALTNNFEDVVQALSGTATVNGEVKRGLAATAVTGLNRLMGPTGVVISQSNGAESMVKRYQADLEKLEERMKGVLARYQKQFAVMESLVGNISSMRESLKGQFESLAAMYSKN